MSASVPEPPLVRRALELERRLGFQRSSIAEVGRLLYVLAAQRGRTRVGEIGTGCGVGAAWIVSALPPAVPFVTVELDERLAAASAELFAEDENVRVLQGEWHELMPREAPFDLLFYDGGGKQHPEVDGEQVVGLLAPGATIVMDDLTPSHPRPDPVRKFWLGYPHLAAIELFTTPETAAIVATRVL
ncbi:MAG TPA: class I SAM-dependent methyltransferase [Gaiellaceae bacterium]|nr:class I SAM-dependent methyltransferase [Gaiellaceae bacterium]